MNFAITAFGVVMLGATPAVSAGFEQIMVPDPAGASLEVGVWYPSKSPRRATTAWTVRANRREWRGGRGARFASDRNVARHPAARSKAITTLHWR
jgi:hypothetical protein